MSFEAPLQVFDPLVAGWFADTFGRPTEAQRLAWPAIAAGEHVLLSAPTGSGKTLAAFLWALDRLASGAWEGGGVRTLYVSPLRALGNDMRRNLELPLAGLQAAFAAVRRPMPPVRVAVRTGDTPEGERRRMAASPPELLVTTPESLNLLLLTPRGRRMLEGVRTVILDEVHAVAGGKRGLHLITAVERLAEHAGEFQRIGLSATIRPTRGVAEWLGGLLPSAAGGGARAVRVLTSRAAKAYRVEVHYPVAGEPGDDPDTAVWRPAAAAIARRLARNRATLVFANSRRAVERMARLLGEECPERPVYAHHGSLAREVREVVEARLKAGQLAGIVATSSLELGIDIGELDEVVLVQAPPSVAAAVQRVGRAGHGVGDVSRGTFLPLSGRALLAAAVMAPAVVAGDIEPTRTAGPALDVLAQVLLAMVVERERRPEELLEAVRRAHPYHRLSPALFERVLGMLEGRWASSRVRELRPLVSRDPLSGAVRPRPGARFLLLTSGGTIPDRGTYHLRLAEDLAPLGTLDEEFVWERKVGDTFTLGVQTWRIERITHSDVLVHPAAGQPALTPFWRGEASDGTFHLADRLGTFLERVEPELERPDLPRRLAADHLLDEAAAAALIRHLAAQHAALGGILPHRHRVVLEEVSSLDPHGERRTLVLHSLWGGRVNRPLALALAAAVHDRLGVRPAVEHDDDAVLLQLPGHAGRLEPFELVTAANVDELVRRGLESTGFFGARFREAAGIALLLPREGPRRRVPLWLNRERAKQLLEAVAAHDDFPLRLEAWRVCLEEEMDLAALRQLLEELAAGRVELRRVRTAEPSPFAAGVWWRHSNWLMYEDDVPTSPAAPPRPALLAEVTRSSHLRPQLRPEVVAEVVERLQRLAPGWAPGTPEELLDWVEERLLLGAEEWRRLLAAIARDGADPAALLAALGPRVLGLRRRSGAGEPLVVGLRDLGRVQAALALAPDEVELLQADLERPLPSPPPRSAVAAPDDADLAELVATWLRFQGPVPAAAPARVLGAPPAAVSAVLDALAGEGAVVVDVLGAEEHGLQVCDAVNLERLLRRQRTLSRPQVTTRPADWLPLLLAHRHGLTRPGTGPEAVQAALARLLGTCAPAALWEQDLLPARVEGYQPAWLDALLGETELYWRGCGVGRLGFLLEGDEPLLAPAGEEDARATALLPAVGRLPLVEVVRHSGLDTGAATTALWRLAWRGGATTDSFAPVRQGIANRFRPPSPAPTAAGGRRARLARWGAARPFAGSWYRTPPAAEAADPLEEDERARERARLLLDRYGLLARDLVAREPEPLQWRGVFRALRLMELAGEVVGGRFIAGLSMPQFATPELLRQLVEGVQEDVVWWVNAADPASPCGLGLPGLELPARRPTSHLVFHGRRPVVVSESRGRILELRFPPGHPLAERYLEPLGRLLTRAVQPLRALSVERINGAAAAASPWAPLLARLFDAERGRDRLILRRRFAGGVA